jgi:hypothetical protein
MPWPFQRTQSAQARVDTKKETDRVETERKKEADRVDAERITNNPSARFPPTQILFTDTDFAEPPSLNYSLYPRIKYIAFFWTLVVLDVVCLPIILYFVLWYKTKLSHNAGESQLQTMPYERLIRYSLQYINRRPWHSLNSRILHPLPPSLA